MDGAGDENSSTSGKAFGHEDGFGRSSRAVVHGCVGDFLTRELAHQGLEFKNRLQRALGDFGLIRRIGSEEFTAQKNRVRDYRTKVIVDSCSQKTGVAERIFSGTIFEIGNYFGF